MFVLVFLHEDDVNHRRCYMSTNGTQKANGLRNRNKSSAQGRGGRKPWSGSAAERRNNAQRPSTRRTPNEGGNKIMAPVAMGGRQRYRPPQIVQRSRNSSSVVIAHSEYIQDILGSVNPFVVNAQGILNPGYVLYFPWLAYIAQRFESYRFRRLSLKFKTECATTQTGFIIIVVDFNSNDPIPISKIQMLQYESALKGSVWMDHTVNLRSVDLNKRKSYFVRAPGQIVADSSVYDTANAFIAVGGQTSNTIIGELWVDYEVELMTAELNPVIPANGFNLESAGTVNAGAPYGTAPTLVQGVSNSIGRIIPNGTGNGPAFQFLQPFSGLVTQTFAGTGITGLPALNSGTTNVQSIANIAPAIINAAATGGSVTNLVNALPSQLLDLAVSATATTLSAAGLRCGSYPVSNG